VKKILIILIAVPVFLWSVWIAFPGKIIRSVIENSVADRRINVEVRDVQKGLFYDFRIGDVIVKGFGGELLSLRNIHGRINPAGLAKLRLELSVDGDIGQGDVSGRMHLYARRTNAAFEFKNVRISDLSLLRLAGIKGTGTVSGRFSVTGDKAHVDFITGDAGFEPAVFSGTIVPLNLFQKISGAVDINGNLVDISSIYLEGKDIHARLKGGIKADYMDMSLELMPGKTLIENPLFFRGFDKYMISPGYYVIPVRGNLVL
jgi:type II secretion system protein N